MGLNNTYITWQSQVKYLRTLYQSNLSDEKDIPQKRGIFISAVNRLNSVFSNIPADVKVHLLQIYCSSWYGCQSWQLDTSFTKDMNTAWQIAIRKAMRIPARTRSKLLPVLAGNACFSHQHHQRVFNMFHTMKMSKNQVIQFIFERGIQSSIGIVGRNHIYLRLLYGYQTYAKWNRLVNFKSDTSDLNCRVSQIWDLIDARDGRGQIEHMNSTDINNLLEFVCTY